MFNADKLFGGQIGPDQSGKFKISMMGLAMKDESGSFVAYNREQGEMTDVMDMTFDGMEGAIFRLPVVEVEEGDLISHGKDLLYVETVNGNRVTALNPFTSKLEVVVPKGNLFGFKFFIKVVSLFDQMMGGFGEPDPKNPMKSVAPFLMMSMMGGSKKEEGYGSRGGQQQSNGFEAILPMLMLPQLMGNKEEGAGFDIQSILPLMMFSGMNGGQGNGNNMMQMFAMTQLLGNQGEGGLFGSLTKPKAKNTRGRGKQQNQESAVADTVTTTKTETTE